MSDVTRFVESLAIGIGEVEDGGVAESVVFVQMAVAGEAEPVVLSMRREALKRFVVDLTTQAGRAWPASPPAQSKKRGGA